MARVKEAAAKTAAAIQERPLTIMAAIAAWAFLFGRLTGSSHVHYHHRRS
jgi:hypothetical protein